VEYRAVLSRSAALVVVVSFLLVGLPVVPVTAQELAPETRGEQLPPLQPLEGSAEGTGPGDERDAAEEWDAQSSTLGDEAGQAGPAPLEDGSIGGASAEEPDATQRSEPTEAPFPFTGLGFKGEGASPPLIRWRVLDLDGIWSDWSHLELLDEHDGPDAASDSPGQAVEDSDGWVSDAVWVGEASHLQVEVTGAPLDDVEVTVIDAAGLSETVLQRASRHIRSLGTQPAAEAAVNRPPIITRAQWGANESLRTWAPRYNDLKFVVLHHTASSNGYSRDQAAQQVRNIYWWHAHPDGMGWGDIGYNFIVDQYGRIYEGRYGGMDRGVIAGHAYNWNANSFGVALMGNYNTRAPSAAELSALADLIAWKFSIHGINPSETATTFHNSQTVPTFVSHRNVRGAYAPNPSTTTDCPGQQLYTLVSGLRASVADRSMPWTPVVGDWNGDGRTTVGWYRDGRWRLRNSNTAGPADIVISFGRSGDLPVVGDWNRDGRSSIGVYRAGTWHLRMATSGAGGDLSFGFGRTGDIPLVGDWNGDGRDTIGIVRDGAWHLRNSLTGGDTQVLFNYGRVTLGDVPVVGDWNGNGRSTPGIIRDGTWHLRNRASGGHGEIVFSYGRLTRGDLPVIGDWSRNGNVTVGVVRDRSWLLRNALSGGAADVSFVYSPR
jgi:hypothetical protein